jgi:hypothetical protein
MRTLIPAALAVALLAPAHRADAPKGKETVKPKATTVPFELLRSGHMAVQVKVNGKGPFKLIFDTGAPMSLVNNKLAKEAGLLKGMPKPFWAPFGSMGEAKIKTLEVGAAKEHDVPTIVMDHPTVEQISKILKTRIDGLVGFPFFARFSMVIDYQAKTMTLTPNGYKPPDAMKAMNEVLMGAFAGALSGKPPPLRVLAPAAQWGLLAGKEAGDEEAGVDVKSVVPGGPAAAAGLKRGDRLLTLDGRWTDSLADLYEAAGFVKPGVTVEVRVGRGGKEVTLRVTPGKGM